MSATENTHVRGSAILSESLSGEGPYKVHGVAIGNNETTTGLSGQKKYWPEEALSEAAESLAGKNVVKNHVNNDVDAVVGAVTEARHHPEYGVIYEGEIDDEELAKKVARNRLDVSPRIIHAHVDELEENDDGALVVDDVREFVNLALVPQGAAESNEIEIGHSGMLSVSREDLRDAFDYQGEEAAEEDVDDADDLGTDEDLEIEDPVQSSEESSQESGEEPEDGDAGNEVSDPDDEELEEDDDVGDDEESILSELSVLGADSEDTDDVDLTEIEILR